MRLTLDDWAAGLRAAGYELRGQQQFELFNLVPADANGRVEWLQLKRAIDDGILRSAGLADPPAVASTARSGSCKLPGIRAQGAALAHEAEDAIKDALELAEAEAKIALLQVRLVARITAETPWHLGT